jgi:thiol-disulfide isomerase/thioredoxin
MKPTSSSSDPAPPVAIAVPIPATTPAVEEASAPAAPSAALVDLKILNWEETEKLIASHQGKIVVMDVWSTACLPCMREFPNLVALDKKHRTDGVACISLSLDYDGIKDKPPESYRERVLKFLTKSEATFDNVLSNVPSDDLLDKHLELASMPAVYVYGRDGKLVKRFDNESVSNEIPEFTYKDVTKLVAELLAK